MLVTRVGAAVDETLGAIAALQNEALAGDGLGELLAEAHDFPTGDERRQLAQLAEDAVEGGGVGVLGLLQRRPLAPRLGRPLRHGGCARNCHEFTR